MQLVATEEEWLRIIRMWSPGFRITYRGVNGGVMTTMKLWAIGTTARGFPSIEEALAFTINHCKGDALKMCELVEDEQSKNR